MLLYGGTARRWRKPTSPSAILAETHMTVHGALESPASLLPHTHRTAYCQGSRAISRSQFYELQGVSLDFSLLLPTIISVKGTWLGIELVTRDSRGRGNCQNALACTFTLPFRDKLPFNARPDGPQLYYFPAVRLERCATHLSILKPLLRTGWKRSYLKSSICQREA